MIMGTDNNCANLSDMRTEETLTIKNEHGTSTYRIINKGSMWVGEVIVYQDCKQRGMSSPIYADTRDELITYIEQHADRDPNAGRKININFNL